MPRAVYLRARFRKGLPPRATLNARRQTVFGLSDVAGPACHCRPGTASMWHAFITLPCALLAPASVPRSDQRRLVARASTYSANRPPVPVPVWSEPLVRLLTADAGRLRDQLDCDDMCQITCLAQWASTRTPLARWAADRSMLSLQRHWDDAVYRHWLQVSTLRSRRADAVDWLQDRMASSSGRSATDSCA